MMRKRERERDTYEGGIERGVAVPTTETFRLKIYTSNISEYFIQYRVQYTTAPAIADVDQPKVGFDHVERGLTDEA